MIKEFLFLLISIVAVLHPLQSQIKYEREYRINTKEVPELALDFVSDLAFSKKVKWYREEGIDKSSVEAKTKHDLQKYSVEFSLTGEIEDIEIEIKPKELPPEVHDAIVGYFNTTYQKAKICKIQIQFSGDPKLLIKTVLNKHFYNNQEVVTHYEIVVKVKGDKEHQKLEYLFDYQGKMVSKAVILLKNTDNLEY